MEKFKVKIPSVDIFYVNGDDIRLSVNGAIEIVEGVSTVIAILPPGTTVVKESSIAAS